MTRRYWHIFQLERWFSGGFGEIEVRGNIYGMYETVKVLVKNMGIEILPKKPEDNAHDQIDDA